LNASIYFDFRLVAGNPDLLVEMKNMVVQKAKVIPRFIKLLADNSLSRKVPISWHGGIDTIKIEDQECIDLKLHGTAILVDAARIYSLAHGISDTNTRERLIAVGLALGIPESEYLAWVSAFEFLQMLRLSVQIDSHPIGGNFNALELSSLNNIDRRILKESLRATRDLQQRIELDYGR
jgi:CBS domain-containing protein